MRQQAPIVQLVGYAPRRQSHLLGEIGPEPVKDDTTDPKKRLLLAGLLVGSCFLMAKAQKFL